MNKHYIILGCIATLLTTQLRAQETEKTKKEEKKLEEVVISSQSLFVEKDANERASSHIHINTKELKRYNYSDPNRVLMGRNGISIIEEDGFGLRPNIIIRGASSYRSSSINLMEDGILAAPAPYIAPAAYYFPTIGRMAGVEILKSAGQILYGPNTVGGSMNFISTQVPDSFALNSTLSYGSFNSRIVSLSVGDKIGKFGYVVDFYNNASDGFKTLPNGKNTGFNQTDGMIKLLYDNSEAKIPNKLQLKIQLSNLRDNETYMGISKEDFKNNPTSRYLSSELDNMKNNHKQVVLSYEIKPIKNLSLNFDIYHNEFKRNWYKVNDIRIGSGKKIGLSTALRASQNSDTMQILRGEYTGANTVFIRNNNRKYYSQGVQLNGSYKIVENGKLRFGIRYHREAEDRYQWDERFRSTAVGLAIISKDIPGSQSNQIIEAQALASYLQYQHKINKFTFTGGARIESIAMQHNNYGRLNPDRIKDSLKIKKLSDQIIIPGISVLYNYHESGSIFASIHRGFSPAGINTSNDAKSELSWNYEIGTRWRDNFIDGEFSFYVNDYSNMLGTDANFIGGGSGQGNMYNVGAALVAGSELAFRYTILGKGNNINFPISANYTYFHSSFKKDFTSQSLGSVKKGDALPFIPTQIFTLEASANINNFSIGIITRYRGDVRNRAGQGPISENQLVPAVVLIDAVVRYQITEQTNVFVTGQNLTNQKYLATLNPAGYRPGMPLFVSGGINIKL